MRTWHMNYRVGEEYLHGFYNHYRYNINKTLENDKDRDKQSSFLLANKDRVRVCLGDTTT